jgi:hypothetical protein
MRLGRKAAAKMVPNPNLITFCIFSSSKVQEKVSEFSQKFADSEAKKKTKKIFDFF